MKELYNLGLTNKDFNFILSTFLKIKEIEDYQIAQNINILRQINCNERQIRNIVISNPQFLNRVEEDIVALIKILKTYDMNNLNLLFDSNPFLLNKDAFEIENYIKNELESGKMLQDIVDKFQLDPYQIDEIKGE